MDKSLDLTRALYCRLVNISRDKLLNLPLENTWMYLDRVFGLELNERYSNSFYMLCEEQALEIIYDAVNEIIKCLKDT